MKNTLLLSAIIILISMSTTQAHQQTTHPAISAETPSDSSRLAELDQYWSELARTVREGDFKGYTATYHDDAIVIFATGEKKMSIPVSSALAGWKQGFDDTEAGNAKSNVEFRFSQRIGNATTAHETGIFHYTSADSEGNTTADQLVHFEMLMIKKGGVWLGMMEYQKSIASQEEWDALK